MADGNICMPAKLDPAKLRGAGSLILVYLKAVETLVHCVCASHFLDDTSL